MEWRLGVIGKRLTSWASRGIIVWPSRDDTTSQLWAGSRPTHQNPCVQCPRLRRCGLRRSEERRGTERNHRNLTRRGDMSSIGSWSFCWVSHCAFLGLCRRMRVKAIDRRVLRLAGSCRRKQPSGRRRAYDRRTAWAVAKLRFRRAGSFASSCSWDNPI